MSLKRRADDNIRILVTTGEDSCLSLSLRNNNRKWLEAGEFRLGRSFLKLVNLTLEQSNRDTSYEGLFLMMFGFKVRTKPVS